MEQLNRRFCTTHIDKETNPTGFDGLSVNLDLIGF
jgi:hypothetical protein